MRGRSASIGSGILSLPLALAFALSCAAPCSVAAADPWTEIRAHVAGDLPRLESLYRHLHTHPELSYQEKETAGTVAAELERAGFSVTRQVGGHGVVGVLRQGPGPTLLIRTDLDALPVQEQTGLPYASTALATDDRGNQVHVMHACGHDMHMTVFAGTAALLAKFRERWRGTLVFIAQPAEERGGGARAMLADGLFQRFPKPEACLALHVSAELPAGSISYVEGFSMANVDSVDITVRGIGGHGAFPHKTRDPIVLAAQIILALQTVVSREVDPLEPAVVTVGSIHGGTKHNIIPEDVRLQLTVRSFTAEVREQTLQAIRRIARGTALAAGLPEDRLPQVTVSDEFTPACYNNPELTRRLAAAFRPVLGDDHVVAAKPMMGGEDFGRFGSTPEKIPICMFGLGTVEPSRWEANRRAGTALPSLHSPLYAPWPAKSIETGVLAMAAAVFDLAKP